LLLWDKSAEAEAAMEVSHPAANLADAHPVRPIPLEYLDLMLPKVGIRAQVAHTVVDYPPEAVANWAYNLNQSELCRRPSKRLSKFRSTASDTEDNISSAG